MYLKCAIMAVAFTAALPVDMYGQSLDGDSLSVGRQSGRIEWRQAILPASLIGAGAVALVPGFVRDGSRDVTDGVIDMRGSNGRLWVDDYVQYLPVAGSLVLGCSGVRGRHSFRERTLIVCSSYAALAVLTNVPKLCVNEKRPEFEAENSFPSGHTATAFMGAELVRMEYGGWYGLGAYAVAAGVGFMRMYNGRHWLHDVVAGAGVGILSARIGEWSALLWRNVLAVRGKGHRDFVLTPVASPVCGGNYGVAVRVGL